MHIHKSLVLKEKDSSKGVEVLCIWVGGECIMIDPDGNILDKVYDIIDLPSDLSIKLDLSKEAEFFETL